MTKRKTNGLSRCCCMSNRLSNLTIISLAESILYSSHTTSVFVVQSLEVVCISEIKNVGVHGKVNLRHIVYILYGGCPYFGGHYKICNGLDSGLEYGLDCGLDSGLTNIQF